MLQQIRGTMKNIFAFFIIALLILAFAAWGVPELRQFTQNHAVRVGHEGISIQEVQKEFDRFVTNRRLANDGQFDREAAIEAGLPDQIVNSMATQSAMKQDAQDMGLVVTRKAVTEFLQGNEQFKNPQTGKFDNQALMGILREYNYGVREFEDRIQSDLLRNQVIAAVTSATPAPKAIVDALILRETESRTVSILTITEEMAAAAPEATAEILKEFHTKHAADFMAPEYRTFTAVVLKAADYVEDGAIPEEDIRKAYDASKSKYETPERRTIYQITYQEAAKAKEAVASLNAGAPFETLATENGQTLADVTFENVLKRDLLDPKVAAAAFSAPEAGAVAGPIDGVFGSTVLQVAAITPAETRPYEDVRSEIGLELASNESKKRLFETIEVIESARDTGVSLAEAAKKAGAVAQDFGPVDSYSFGKGGEIIADIPGDVLKEAFVVEEGEESDSVELADKSGYFLVAVNEVAPPAIIPLDTIKDEVEAKWRADDRESRLAAVVKKVRDAIDGGKSLKDASAPFNRAPTTEVISRRNPNDMLSEALNEQVFSAAKGETISGPAALGDAQIVMSIDDVAYAVSMVSPEEVAMFSQFIGNQLGQEIVDAYASAVRDDADVKINQTQIDEAFNPGL